MKMSLDIKSHSVMLVVDGEDDGIDVSKLRFVPRIGEVINLDSVTEFPGANKTLKVIRVTHRFFSGASVITFVACQPV